MESQAAPASIALDPQVARLTTVRRDKICFAVASTLTAEAFLSEHIAALSIRFEAHLVINAGPATIASPALRKATLHRANIERAIAPIADLRALGQLAGIFRRERFTAVHSVSPKAGLLTALAGFIARVPVRIHTFTGQVWATRHGPARLLLKGLDRLIASLNTHILVDSHSQRDFLRAEGVLAAGQGDVLGRGSVCGVDPQRFRPDPAMREKVRHELGLPREAVVCLFVGRLNRDKGVLDLARAFATVAARCPAAFLVLVGPDEGRLGPVIEVECADVMSRVRLAGYSREPQRFMAAADVFCLPSYREGFGTTIIEAAACGVPAIGSRIYGITDAIEHEVTGLLHAPGNVSELAACMLRLSGDPDLRRRMGGQARARALRDFNQDLVTEELMRFYESALAQARR